MTRIACPLLLHSIADLRSANDCHNSCRTLWRKTVQDAQAATGVTQANKNGTLNCGHDTSSPSSPAPTEPLSNRVELFSERVSKHDLDGADLLARETGSDHPSNHHDIREEHETVSVPGGTDLRLMDSTLSSPTRMVFGPEVVRHTGQFFRSSNAAGRCRHPRSARRTQRQLLRELIRATAPPDTVISCQQQVEGTTEGPLEESEFIEHLSSLLNDTPAHIRDPAGTRDARSYRSWGS